MPNPWKASSSGPTDLNEVSKWQINDMKETRERWKKEKEEELKKTTKWK